MHHALIFREHCKPLRDQCQIGHLQHSALQMHIRNSPEQQCSTDLGERNPTKPRKSNSGFESRINSRQKFSNGPHTPASLYSPISQNAHTVYRIIGC